MAKNSPHLRILIVEDEMLIRWSISETLMHAGYNVVEAGDGAAALRALSNEPVDAVVLDFRLPDSDDLTLLARIRSLAPGTPVIMMTAFGTPEMTTGARELGAYTVMYKPFEMHVLEANLQAACAQSSRIRSHKETHMATAAAGINYWLQLIQAEYLEIPGLHLTRPQVRRLWNLDEDTCDVLLRVLEGAHFLRRTPRDGYVLNGATH